MIATAREIKWGPGGPGQDYKSCDVVWTANTARHKDQMQRIVLIAEPELGASIERSDSNDDNRR